MIYRVTLGFAGEQFGWSETHLLNSDITTPSQLAPLALLWMQKRAELLGLPFAVTVCRFAKYLNVDGTRATRGVFMLKQFVQQSGQSRTGSAEPANVAALFKFRNATFPNVKNVYIGAPSDAAVDNGGFINPALGGFNDNANSYAAFLFAPPGPGTNRIGWGATQLMGDFKILKITQNMDFTFRVQTTVPHGLPNDGKTVYPSRIRRVSQGRSAVNGDVNLLVSGLDTFDSQELITFGPEPVGGFVKVYNPLRAFLSYDSYEYELQTAKHKRGRPFGSEPGRAPKRIRA